MARLARPKPHPESLAVGALLTALVALGQISTSIYIPSLPFLVDALFEFSSPTTGCYFWCPPTAPGGGLDLQLLGIS